MPRLSIVIPFLGNVKLLEDTLLSVLENRPEACQIVVVLNQGYEDPYALCSEVSFVASRPDAGMIGGLYRGLLACEAPVVHVLACGMEVTPGWTDGALPHFEDLRVGAVAPLVLDSARPHRVVSAGVAYRCGGRVRCLSEGRPATRPALRRLPCGPDARAAFYRRSALIGLAGWNDGMGRGLTGADLALSLRHQGFRCVVEPGCHTFAQPALVHPPSAFRTGIDEGRLFWRWASCHGWGKSLAGHAALLFCESLGALLRPYMAVRMAGRLAGGLSTVGHRGHTPLIPPAGAVPSPHFRRPALPDQLVTATASRGSSASNLSDVCSSGPAAPRRAPG